MCGSEPKTLQSIASIILYQYHIVSQKKNQKWKIKSNVVKIKKKVRWVLTVLEGPTWPSSLMIALAPANHYVAVPATALQIVLTLSKNCK